MPDLVKIEKVNLTDCGMMSGGGESYYPYGTQLNLQNETLEKLDLGALKPGDVVEVRGYAVVESISQRADGSESHKSLGIQLTEISVSRKQESPDYASQLYAGA